MTCIELNSALPKLLEFSDLKSSTLRQDDGCNLFRVLKSRDFAHETVKEVQKQGEVKSCPGLTITEEKSWQWEQMSEA